MPTVDLTLKADLSGLKKQLSEGIGRKEARRLVAELNKSIKAQERAAKKVKAAMDSASKETEKFKKSLEGSKQAAEAIGGKIGELSGRIEKAGQSFASFSAALGPAGPLVLGVGALAVAGTAYATAIAAVGTGIVSLIRQTDELLAQNAEFQEFFAPVDAGNLQAIHEFTDATDGVAIAAQQVAIVLGGQLAAELAETSRIVLQVSLAFADFAGRVNLGKAALEGLAIAFLGPTGAKAAIAVMPKILDAADSATSDYATSASDLADKIRQQRQEQKEAADASRAQAAAEREAAEAMREAERAAQARAKATETLNESIFRSTLAVVDPLTALEMQFERQQVAILDAAVAAGNLELGMEALAAAQVAYDADVEKTIDSMIQFKQSISDVEVEAEDARSAIQRMVDSDLYASIQTNMQGIGILASEIEKIVVGFADLRIEQIEKVANAERDAIEQNAAEYRELEQAKIEALLDQGRISEEEAAAQMEAADRWVASEHQRADDLVKIREEEALKAFKVAQQTKIAAATVAAALNAIELTGALIPTLGVGAPFAAAAIAAGQLALTIAQIKATEPPTFALGGSVAARMGGGADHALISASPAEGIVSPRGMMALGQEGLDALNRGTTPGTSVSIMLDRQIIASAVVDSISRDGRAANAVRVQSGARTGQTLVYGRG